MEYSQAAGSGECPYFIMDNDIVWSIQKCIAAGNAANQYLANID